MATRTRVDIRGFTLVELMIVVAIIGVLAALAIYSVSRYLKQAKTAEATRSLGAIAVGDQAQYSIEVPPGASFATDVFVHMFCQNASVVPSTGTPPGRKVKASAAEWDSDGWKCLKFSLNEPQNYAYSHESNAPTDWGLAARYTAMAFGNLDGDTEIATFIVTGQGTSTGDGGRSSLVIINETE